MRWGDLLAERGQFVAGRFGPAFAEPVQPTSWTAFACRINLLFLPNQPSGVYQLRQDGIKGDEYTKDA